MNLRGIALAFVAVGLIGCVQPKPGTDAITPKDDAGETAGPDAGEMRDGGERDAGPVDDAGPAPTSNVSPVSGGGSGQSSSYRIRAVVGPAQPVGDGQSDSRRIKLQPPR